jgi:chromosome segregation ATPase
LHHDLQHRLEQLEHQIVHDHDHIVIKHSPTNISSTVNEGENVMMIVQKLQQHFEHEWIRQQHRIQRIEEQEERVQQQHIEAARKVVHSQERHQHRLDELETQLQGVDRRLERIHQHQLESPSIDSSFLQHDLETLRHHIQEWEQSTVKHHEEDDQQRDERLQRWQTEIMERLDRMHHIQNQEWKPFELRLEQVETRISEVVHSVDRRSTERERIAAHELDEASTRLQTQFDIIRERTERLNRRDDDLTQQLVEVHQKTESWIRSQRTGMDDVQQQIESLLNRVEQTSEVQREVQDSLQKHQRDLGTIHVQLSQFGQHWEECRSHRLEWDRMQKQQRTSPTITRDEIDQNLRELRAELDRIQRREQNHFQWKREMEESMERYWKEQNAKSQAQLHRKAESMVASSTSLVSFPPLTIFPNTGSEADEHSDSELNDAKQKYVNNANRRDSGTSDTFEEEVGGNVTISSYKSRRLFRRGAIFDEKEKRQLDYWKNKQKPRNNERIYYDE